MEKVLLVCFDNLGDLVFASAIALSLAADPEVQLSLLCKDYTSRIGYLLPGVEKVYAADPYWDKAPNRKKGKLAHFMRCLLTVRSQEFDRAILVGTSWQAALALRMAGIPKVLTLKGRKNRFGPTERFPLPARDIPVVEGLLASFAPALKHTVPPRTVLLKERFPNYERPLALRGARLVVLHAFAGSPLRCASLDLWGAVAESLRADGYHVLWTGIPLETQKIRQAFPGLWGPQHFVDTWAQDLLQLAWIWTEAELFAGHDSGPLHVAHALGVPVLGLYLPGEPLRTFPQGAAPAIMLSRSSPADLKAVEVVDAARRLLQKGN